jgi:hypothetical protein
MAMPSVTVIVVNSRGVPRGGDAFLNRLRLARERNVARRRLVPGRRDADQRLIDLLLGRSHRIEERAMRRPFGSNRDMPARQARLIDRGLRTSPGMVGSRRRRLVKAATVPIRSRSIMPGLAAPALRRCRVLMIPQRLHHFEI